MILRNQMAIGMNIAISIEFPNLKLRFSKESPATRADEMVTATAVVGFGCPTILSDSTTATATFGYCA